MTEMKSAFDGLINKLDLAEERINELEDINRNFKNWDSKSKKNKKYRTKYSNDRRTLIEVAMCIYEEYQINDVLSRLF